MIGTYTVLLIIMVILHNWKGVDISIAVQVLSALALFDAITKDFVNYWHKKKREQCITNTHLS